MTADGPVTTLTILTTRLADLLAAENDVLKSRRPAELARTQDEKARLAGAYEQQMTAMRRDPQLLREADPAAVQALKAAVERFRTLLHEHGRRVAAAKSVTERLFKSVTEEAIQRRRRVEGYDGTATLRPAFGKGQDTVPLALNQVV